MMSAHTLGTANTKRQWWKKACCLQSTTEYGVIMRRYFGSYQDKVSFLQGCSPTHLVWMDRTREISPPPPEYPMMYYRLHNREIWCHVIHCYMALINDQVKRMVWNAGSNFLIPPMMMALSLDVVCIWFHRCTKKTCKARNRIEQITVKKSVHLVTDETRQRSCSCRKGTCHTPRGSALCRFNGYLVWILQDILF